MGNCFGSRSSIINPSFSESVKKFPNRTKIGSRDVVTKPEQHSRPGKAPAAAVGGGSGNDTASKLGTTTNVAAAVKSGNDDGKTMITPNLKMFTLTELKKATRDFRPDTMLGEGGFGRVFKGWVDEKTYAPSKVGVGIAVAVKKSNPDSSQGLKEWQSEVKFLGKFSHQNLVKLLGYCWEENQFLLVYEYMQKGSLENHLFRKGAEPLSWGTRLKIAIGAARGLSFLHNSEKSVIYRDFKTSNILLDGEFNAKLSDFGLAKFGPINGNSHVTTSIMGTYGYAAPEYVATGHLYLKSDVFGFGVVLLELMTGLRALDPNRPSGQHVLVDWAKPSLTEKKKLRKIMDPGLAEEYPIKGARKVADLILKCIEPEPKNRPSMELVSDTLETINNIPISKKNKNLGIDVQFHGKRHDECSSSHSNHRHYNSPHGKSPIRQKNGVAKSPYRRQAQ